MRKQFFWIIFLCFASHCWTQEIATTVDSISEKQIAISIDTLKNDTIDLPEPIVQKRQLPQNFKNKYNDSDFVYEAQLSERNWWSRLKEKIARFFNNIFNISNSNDSAALVDLILKILAVIIIVVVVFLIVKSILNKEGQWIFGKSSDKRILKIEDAERNLHLLDFEKLIQETLKKGDSRLVIRYYYLWLLKKMTEKNIIEWDLEKTNSDYIREIKSENLKEKFVYLSYLYNNVWYGAFDIEPEAFERIKIDFKNTLNNLKS